MLSAAGQGDDSVLTRDAGRRSTEPLRTKEGHRLSTWALKLPLGWVPCCQDPRFVILLPMRDRRGIIGLMPLKITEARRGRRKGMKQGPVIARPLSPSSCLDESLPVSQRTRLRALVTLTSLRYYPWIYYVTHNRLLKQNIFLLLVKYYQLPYVNKRA